MTAAASTARISSESSALAQTDWTVVETPALTVDVARMEANIAATAAAFAEAKVALRPHFKTSKCLPVARRQLAAGAIGFTCSTPAEVRLLAGEGIGGLLWAHQPVGPGKVQTAVEVAGTADLTIIVDSLAVAGPVAAAADKAGASVPFMLEINTGQGRTGVEPADAAAVAVQLNALPGLTFRGVLTHEGHLSQYLGDRPALESAAAGVGQSLAAVAASIRDAGLDCTVVSVGSTPGIKSAPFAAGVTEGRPGTYVYYDANQVRLGTCTLDQCASSVLTRVVSVNRSGSAIIDAGLKAMSSDSLGPANGAGMVVDLHGKPLSGLDFVTANEEHGFLAGDGTASLRVGDLLRVIPHHACGTTNMWSRLLAVHPDGRTERWQISARH